MPFLARFACMKKTTTDKFNDKTDYTNDDYDDSTLLSDQVHPMLIKPVTARLISLYWQYTGDFKSGVCGDVPMLVLR